MPTYLFLRRLRRSPAAFSGLTLVILLVLTALFAPWLAPHDPTWPAYARQARSEIQRLRHSDYLAAAEMLGIRGGRLLVGHILPLCLPSAIVRLALADGGVGSDDCRRDAGDFRPMVDRRHPRRGDPARQPGV